MIWQHARLHESGCLFFGLALVSRALGGFCSILCLQLLVESVQSADLAILIGLFDA